MIYFGQKCLETGKYVRQVSFLYSFTWHNRCDYSYEMANFPRDWFQIEKEHLSI